MSSKSGCGHRPLKPELSGTTGSIFIKQILFKKEFNKDSNLTIIEKKNCVDFSHLFTCNLTLILTL